MSDTERLAAENLLNVLYDYDPRTMSYRVSIGAVMRLKTALRGERTEPQ